MSSRDEALEALEELASIAGEAHCCGKFRDLEETISKELEQPEPKQMSWIEFMNFYNTFIMENNKRNTPASNFCSYVLLNIPDGVIVTRPDDMPKLRDVSAEELQKKMEAIQPDHIVTDNTKVNVEMAELCDEMASASKAFQKLNICYRMGKNPSEKLFKELEKAKQTLQKYDDLKGGDYE